MMDKSFAYQVYENYKKLSKSLVDIIDNKQRRKFTISAKARIVKKKEDKNDTKLS